MSTHHICFNGEIRTNYTRIITKYSSSQLGSVAQMDARLTGDQEVAGSTPAGSATFFHGN